GLPVVLALVVVPGLSDLTLVCDSVRTPAAGKVAAHPSEPLAHRYPDLQAVEPDRRGSQVMPQIGSDQVGGSAHAVWAGMLMAVLTAGTLTLSGTLAAGYLLRRRQAVLVPYLEITLSVTATLALAGGTVLTAVWSALLGSNPFVAEVLPLAGLAGVT